MPNNSSTEKRLRQDQKRNLRNRAVKSEIKTWTKKALEAIEKKDREVATTCLRTAQAKLDKAIQKGVLHKRTAARRKSLLMRKFAALG